MRTPPSPRKICSFAAIARAFVPSVTQQTLAGIPSTISWRIKGIPGFRFSHAAEPGTIPHDRIPPAAGSPPGFDHGRIFSLSQKPGNRNREGFKKMLDIQFIQKTGDFVFWSPAERKGDDKDLLHRR